MKNTKRARRAAAFAAAVVMAACAAIPMSSSFSASAEGSISISNTATGHTYEAYQIFDGVLNADKVLSNIEWGTGIDSAKTDDLLTAIKAITITTEDGATTPFAACTDAKSVAKVLSDANASFDADITKQFASVVGQYLSDTHTDSTQGTGIYDISHLDDGYYLVKDKDDSLNDVDDSKTRYIVQVLDNKTDITPKSSKPEVIKKVKENTKDVTATGQTFAGKDNYDVGTSYNDVADYCIGDAVPFKLYGTMPDTIDDYSKYKYVFHDTLSKQFDAPAEGNVSVKIDGTDAVGATVSVDSTTNEITVTFNDIKAGNTITKSSIVTVEYNAVLNSSAVIGLNGQENKVYLTYSNNPNWTGTGTETPDDKGKTPEDKVIVFTYELDTTKVDGNDNTIKLENAKFILSRKTAAGADEYAKVTDGKLTGWTTTKGDATELVSGTDGLFKVAGLDSGTYYLTETQAPSGYNTLTDPIKVELTATTVNNQTWDEVAASALTELSVKADEVAGTVDASKGIGSITIANNKGSSLPSTGDIGTTMFYVGGGVLVAGAGVLLITKKRAKKDAE